MWTFVCLCAYDSAHTCLRSVRVSVYIWLYRLYGIYDMVCFSTHTIIRIYEPCVLLAAYDVVRDATAELREGQGRRWGFIYLCVVYVGCVHVFICVVVYGVFLIRWIVAYRKYAHALAHGNSNQTFWDLEIRHSVRLIRHACTVCCMLCVVVYGVALRKQRRCGCMRLENWTAPNWRFTRRLAKRNEMVHGEGAQKDGGRQSNIEGDAESERGWVGEWVVNNGPARALAFDRGWLRLTYPKVHAYPLNRVLLLRLVM